MLQKATPASTWVPGRWAGWRRSLLEGPTSILLRYVLILALFCALGCLYLLQTSELSAIHAETLVLQAEAADLETANSRLVQQLAQWNTPAYVYGRSERMGFVGESDPLRVTITRAAQLPDTGTR